MSTVVARHRMSLAEFLAWEAEQPERHEFVDGEVFAMSGVEANHVRTTRNLVTALHQHLGKGPCEVFNSDMKLQVDERIFYPDVFVTCAEADRQRRQTMQEPSLIVEVLSPSTAAYDRGDKFGFYRRSASLREYALVDPVSRRCDVFRKQADGLWVLHPFEPDEGVELASVSLRIDPGTVFARLDDAQATA